MKKGAASEDMIAAYEEVPVRLRFSHDTAVPIVAGAEPSYNAAVRMLISIGAYQLEQGKGHDNTVRELITLGAPMVDAELSHTLSQHLQRIKRDGFSVYQNALLVEVAMRESGPRYPGMS